MAFFRSCKKQSGGSGGLSVDTFEVTTLPTKTYYSLDEELDTTGMVITATASGMSGNVVPYCSFSPTVFTELGTTPVTASYYGRTAIFNVTCVDVGPLEETSWDKIKQIAETGIGSQYWAVGDTKTITIEGKIGDVTLSRSNYKVFVIGFNHNSVNGIYFQCFMNNSNGNKVVAIYDGTATEYTDGRKVYNFNHWGDSSYGGWKGSDIRYDILGSTDIAPSNYGTKPTSTRVGYDASSTTATNPVADTFMAALPADMRAVMAPMSIYTDNKGTGSNTASNVTESIDYLPLLSEFEVLGARAKANSAEKTYQKQFDYYKNGGSKVFYRHDNLTAVSYYIRSVNCTSSGAKYCLQVTTSAAVSSIVASRIYPISPIFRVA